MLSQVTAVGFVSTTDTVRARAFYEGVLGLEVTADPFALVARVGDAMLRITTLPAFAASEAPVFGFRVADATAETAALAGKGVTFEQYAFLGDAQSPDGVWTGPDGTQVSWFKDPDGNLLSLTSHGV
jgi:catechol 2,3-dioxygenase-like lactoylglutathione lyase family enzyme